MLSHDDVILPEDLALMTQYHLLVSDYDLVASSA